MKEIDMVKTGNRIKELRVERGLTQTQLGKLLGVKTNTVSQYENGLSKTSIDILFKLSIIFEISSDYILGLQD